MFYFKILANCIVYIRACRRGSYTNLYLRECVMWVNVPPVVVYVCKNRLRCSSFTWTQKGKKERPDRQIVSPPYLAVPISTIDRVLYYRKSRIEPGVSRNVISSCRKRKKNRVIIVVPVKSRARSFFEHECSPDATWNIQEMFRDWNRLFDPFR